MTRAEDAAQAAALGARYIGVILAEGPRTVTDAAAQAVFAAVPKGAWGGIARVGVFGVTSPALLAARAMELGLDVVQLHGDPDASTVSAVRALWSGQVWAVQRVDGAELPDAVADLFDVADGVVLDARVAGKLGGTGVALPWEQLRDRVGKFRGRRARLVLAGGLRPENVAHAVDVLQPDVVDVSSGVEAVAGGVGVKDHDRMRAFRDAARGGGAVVHTR